MPGRGTSHDRPYLFISFDLKGVVDGATILFALPEHRKAAIDARAKIIGVKKFQAFEVTNGRNGELEFKRI